MKHSHPSRVMSFRAACWRSCALLLAACGGGETVPFTGVQVRPLSPEFTARRAVAYSPYRTAAGADGLAGEVIPKANIKQDLDLLLAAGIRLIRLFDSSDKVARQTLEVIRDNRLNIKVQLGAFVLSGNDVGEPRSELARCIALANEFSDIVLAVSVGNETMVELVVQPDRADADGRLPAHRAPADRAAGDYRRQLRVLGQRADRDHRRGRLRVDAHLCRAGHLLRPDAVGLAPRDVPEAERAAAMMDAAITETKRQYQRGARLPRPQGPVVHADHRRRDRLERGRPGRAWRSAPTR